MSTICIWSIWLTAKNTAKGKGGYLQLEDNSEIEVSTRRKEEFLKKLASM